jgi:hypothetical protein
VPTSPTRSATFAGTGASTRGPGSDGADGSRSSATTRLRSSVTLGGALAARLAERVTGLPARVDLDRAARYVLISETVRDWARSTGLSLGDSEIAHLGVDPDAEQRRWRVVSLLVARIARVNEIADRERQNRTRHTPYDEGGAIVSPCATLSDHPRQEGGGW